MKENNNETNEIEINLFRTVKIFNTYYKNFLKLENKAFNQNLLSVPFDIDKRFDYVMYIRDAYFKDFNAVIKNCEDSIVSVSEDIEKILNMLTEIMGELKPYENIEKDFALSEFFLYNVDPQTLEISETMDTRDDVLFNITNNLYNKYFMNIACKILDSGKKLSQYYWNRVDKDNKKLYYNNEDESNIVLVDMSDYKKSLAIYYDALGDKSKLNQAAKYYLSYLFIKYEGLYSVVTSLRTKLQNKKVPLFIEEKNKIENFIIKIQQRQRIFDILAIIDNEKAMEMFNQNTFGFYFFSRLYLYEKDGNESHLDEIKNLIELINTNSINDLEEKFYSMLEKNSRKIFCSTKSEIKDYDLYCQENAM